MKYVGSNTIKKILDNLKSLNDNWKKTDKYVTEQEVERQANEDIRKTDETNREANEKSRETAEIIRESNEETRISAEETRKSAESSRETAETFRDTAEKERISNENIRKTNEEAREVSENIRETNEESRKEAETAREEYITDLKERVNKGEFKGDSNVLSIGTVEKGDEAKATITGDSPNQTLNLVLPKGDTGAPGTNGANGKDGEKGADGVGITSIDVTPSTEDGGTNTITVNLSNGTEKTFNVKNGSKGSTGADGANGKDGLPGAKGEDGTSITSVKQTTTSTSDGGTNVITVSLSDGTSSTFQVKNGTKGSAGSNGTNGTNGKNGTSITSVTQTTTSSSDGGTNVIKVSLSDGTSSTFQVKNGSKGSTGPAGTTTYTGLSSLPKLNTTNTTSQSTYSGETITGTINLHKVSKTGSYNDLSNRPTIPSQVLVVNSLTSTSTTNALSAAQGKTLNDGLVGVQLYSNSSGSSGTISLSQSISNFNSIAVEYMVDHGGQECFVREFRTNKSSSGFAGNISFVMRDTTQSQYIIFSGAERLQISSTSISQSSPKEWNTSNGLSSIHDAKFLIKSVYGFLRQ